MKILSSILLIAIVIVSCQKESSTEPPSNGGNGNNPPPNDSTLLWKYIELDPTLPAGSDTTFQETYTYDNKKRLSRIHTNYHGAEEMDDLFYSGTDSLPFMTIAIWTSSQGYMQRDTTFYSYSNGFINKDSTVIYNYTTNQYAETSTFVYTSEGNNTLFQYRHYSAPAVIPDEELKFTLFKTYQNGNITVQEDTSSVVLFSWAHEQVTYDDKINPGYELTPAHSSVLDARSFSAQKNNPVEEISWNTPSQPEHLIYTYTYRADGRPLSYTATDVNASDGWTGIFLYTK